MPILKNIQIKLDFEAVRRRLHLKRDGDLKAAQELVRIAQDGDLKAAQELVRIAQPLVEPKVLYKVSYIEEKLDDGVVIEGLRLTSKVLRKNLDAVERVFPFVITIGNKFGEKLDACNDLLEKFYFGEKLDACNDLLEKFYLDTIGNVALNQVRLALKDHLKQDYAIEKTAFMAPGSLPDWPIEQQKPLFKLLGDVPASIGVQLNDSLLMLPAKSVSGIYFPTETSFISCQLCPREHCESRKATFNEKKAIEFGLNR